MQRCHPCRLQILLGIVLAVSTAPGCAVFLSLDEFDEPSDGGAADGGQDAEDAEADLEAGPCTLTITPQSHNFGPVSVGSTSPPVELKVLNEQLDPIGPLHLFGGANPNPNFVIIAQDCADRTLNPGEFCTVEFVFAPKFPGTAQSAVLVVQVGNRDCGTAFLEGGAPPA